VSTQQTSPEDEGFTLVELSVAMVVLSVIIAALGAFLITAVAQQRSNELRAHAVKLAEQSVEEGRALPWDLVGFYADEAAAATASCGSTGGPTVSIPVPASPATKSGRVPTPGSKTVTVQGQQYTRTVCYRWVDDPADGSGAADTNGTQDVKRFEVVVAWTSRGTSFTHRVEALRAPTADEVAPKSVAGQPFGIVSVTPSPSSSASAPINGTGHLTSALDFSATTTTGVSTVQLRWTDAAGVQQSRTLSGSSATSWSVSLPTGTGPFTATTTTFTFTAFSSTGETSTQNTTVAFSQTPGSLTVTTSATPNSIDVNTAGANAVSFTVQALTNADATSAVLRYKNRSGADTTVSMVKETPTKFTFTFPPNNGPFPDGATTFTASATGAGGTASGSTTVTFVPPAVVPVAVNNATAGPTLCTENNDGTVIRPTTVTVSVDGLATTDKVTLQLNDVAGSKVNATRIGGSGATSTYAYTVPANATHNFKNQAQFTVSVLATRTSDNTQATKIYNFGHFQRNGNESCPTS
jgi:prepilin-type N-terminal cleavage/methylation domain-containing protein